MRELEATLIKTVAVFGAVLCALAITTSSWAQQKPNIVIIWGDDIGYWNISAYNRGMMGYRMPNIDRLAKEGAIFTDAYVEQSCTAGRAAFITGQSPFRTGLTKVGLPGPDGKLPPVGNTVDVANATWSNTIGAPELITVWTDPEFDPEVSAAYSARVLEIPTPRWTAYDAKFFDIDMPEDVAMTVQDRAYTSPIWYTPGK
jgi:hypothetical protein